MVSRLFLLLASASELDASRRGACSSDPVIRDHILDLNNRCNSAVAHLGQRWVSASHGPVHCSVRNGLPCRRDRAPPATVPLGARLGPRGITSGIRDVLRTVWKWISWGIFQEQAPSIVPERRALPGIGKSSRRDEALGCVSLAE